ncbi:alpha/beta fold hydrolase [Mumia sp. zg.B21]|uniref:alpha/beta fold hydrolase n=1 Tax=Mumia sp. zg.B21 TaxID=2855447 RepID=UPI001C6E31FF|nr:alpha/beta fold hydrolase [Mumia sp. zg.B21]MBW9209862.1 alpha/beta fold hydrolase [Mumia sp. zg.B21]
MLSIHDHTTTSADGTVIAYDRRGAGPPLVLVEPAAHFRGFSAFDGLAERLASDFRVYQYDRRGRGLSADTPPYAVSREVEDLAAVVAAAGAPAFAYGFSSGALVALHAAAAGVGLRALALLEPPLQAEPAEGDSAFTVTLESLLAAGRHDEATAYFHRSIGVPDEITDGMRDTPAWEAMVSVAPTLAYDARLSDESSHRLLERVDVPALVLDSSGSTDDLTGWASAASRALPYGSHRSLPGGWHGVDQEALALALSDFFGTADRAAREVVGRQR